MIPGSFISRFESKALGIDNTNPRVVTTFTPVRDVFAGDIRFHNEALTARHDLSTTTACHNHKSHTYIVTERSKHCNSRCLSYSIADYLLTQTPNNMSSGASPSKRTPAQRAVGNASQQLPTPPETPAASRGQQGAQPPNQPQDQQLRYMSYPVFEPRQPQPNPYQSNGSRRRRTQTELQMVHGINWLGYGAVIPNVSVVTGAALLDGPLHTHGTRVMGGKGNYEDEFNDDGDLAARMSRSLTIGVNRNASRGK